VTQVWTKAVETVEVSEDKGDILGVLKRLLEKYAKHIFRIVVRSDHGMNLTEAQRRGLAYYQSAAKATQALIEQ
jgi:hypothetical protein